MLTKNLALTEIQIETMRAALGARMREIREAIQDVPLGDPVTDLKLALAQTMEASEALDEGAFAVDTAKSFAAERRERALRAGRGNR